LNAFARALLTGFGLLAILVLTLAIFGLPIVDSLKLMASGALGDKFGISRTLVKMTPLLLTGLGVVVAWRGGMYNIGGEGQFIVGGVSGAAVARVLMNGHAPTAVLTGGVLVSALLGGAAYGSLAGWLKIRRGVDVVISTILLNFVAAQILSYCVTGPLREPGSTLPLTEQLPKAAMLWQPDRQMDLNAGILIALVMACVIWAFLFRTKPGFILRIVGDNPRAARANRLDAQATQLLAMAISGGLCGLAGAVEYLGISGQIGNGFSQNWGFLGIPVALLGALHPLGLIFSSLVFGGLLAGSTNLARFTTAGDTLIYIVQGAAVLGLVALGAVKFKANRPALATEEA
jgi:simple sugar transport system permease protein